MRDDIEKKFGLVIPIMVDLKGNIIRLGKFKNNCVNLSKGQEFRLFQKKDKLKGNENGCYCDLGDWFDSLNPGDSLCVGFGNYTWLVKSKETLQEGLKNCEIGNLFNKIHKNRL